MHLLCWHIFCTKMDIQDKLRESILRRPVANGLAIIIANENSSNPSHPPLRGARRDLENMKDTFEVLRFATLPILNASKEQVLAAIRAAAKYKNYPPSYKRIAFAFSGNGDLNVIYAHDGVIETDQLYDPLQPLNAPHLAHIPKLFFMDACRGPNEDRGVEVVARGKTGPPRSRIPVPSYGNYVLAFSTMPTMQVYEVQDVGGMWMNIVSKQLRTNRKSILDVLTEVNRELLNEFHFKGFEVHQQPVLEAALNVKPFGLLEEAEELDKQLEVQLSFPPHSEDQEIIIGSQVYPSGNAIPPHSTHKPSSHTLSVPHSDMKPLAPVFMGTTLLEQQRPPQQSQQFSMCQTVPGSRQPTPGFIHLQMNQHTDCMTCRGSSSKAGGAFHDSSAQFPAQTSQETVTSTVQATGSPSTATSTSASVNPSTSAQQSNVIDEGPPLAVADLLDVSEYLSHLKKDQTFRLALVLGLHAVPTLDKIRDTPNFLYDMLTAWLLGQDGVNKRGGHTWGALVKALQHSSVTQNEIADRIQREKCYRH